MTGVRSIIYPEGDYWIVQGLELDICAQGRTREKAWRSFLITLIADLTECERRGVDPAEQIGPAPRRFWDAIEAAP